MSAVWRYDGKRVVVTGCSSGMGQATAAELVDLGAEVVGLDIKPPSVTVKEFVETDLSDPASIDAAAGRIAGGGAINALFNCAGLPNTFPGQQVMLVNFVGPRHLTELLIPHMGPGSAIATISSVAGLAFLENMGTVMELLAIPDFAEAKAWCEAHDDKVAEGYSFSKQCIIVYTMQRSFTLAQQGIRINCTSPGPTDTPMMPHFEQAMGTEYMHNFPKPIGRNARPEEQAYPLIFLNSEAASYITGHNLFTDGGFVGAIMTGQIDPSALVPSG